MGTSNARLECVLNLGPGSQYPVMISHMVCVNVRCKKWVCLVWAEGCEKWVHVCVCVDTCVCVWEEEREREKTCAHDLKAGTVWEEGKVRLCMCAFVHVWGSYGILVTLELRYACMQVSITCMVTVNNTCMHIWALRSGPTLLLSNGYFLNTV